MTKIQSQYEDLNKALGRLKEAVALPADSTINQDATIQRFEFTFELAWKLIQSIEKENSINVYGVKTVIREATKLNLIDEPNKWFEFLENRNLSVHTYEEEIAQRVYKSAKEFIPFAEKLILKAKDYLD
ncbi:nucleotidyltransferase [Candidatus Roizmanbacteria bacterium CG06_land_8_20_14_3_00_34_14]|uniref:Nucleotidyltransferase n=2 Tax=Candidatus Roizmaniibacteriota TaxID=1752723 RepID=A0A2M7AV41_9BACT|nr:MAG: nucleotidyltransferase [Candidatus Roizmanbacteria bacterium CG07_land_8_20_14_0_80_34_15]PIU74449.1 MAG: nucleotidyltransferase [Candidatus Roizmanbacteria bacterium CG06_land_8_20_14_3_00_34_14]